MSFCWISDDGAALPQWLRDLAQSDQLRCIKWQQPLPQETRLAVLDGKQLPDQYQNASEHAAQPRSFPIIIADVEATSDRIALFEAGADDVLPPDIEHDEALARSKRMLSLYAKFTASASDIEHHGTLRFDHGRHKLWREDTPIAVTRREFALLAYLAQAKGRAVPKHELHKAVFNLNFDPGTNALAVHIYRLRKKLQQGFITQILRTVEGRGYALVQDTPAIRPLGEEKYVRNRANHA